MAKSHRDYEFGTFEDRLAHLCAFLEVEPPEIVFEEGEPTLTDPLMDWIKANEVNMDWLFAGRPCAMLREWSSNRAQNHDFHEIYLQLEPEVQAGMLAFLRAVVIHGVAMKEAEPLFAQVVEEYRAGKAA